MKLIVLWYRRWNCAVVHAVRQPKNKFSGSKRYSSFGNFIFNFAFRYRMKMLSLRRSQKLLSKDDRHRLKRFFNSHAGFEWFGRPSELIENVILCSGQGFQYVGMFLDLERNKRVTISIADLMKKANNILGYDIVRLCIEGPKSKIDKTIHCQPAVVLASLVGAELMKKYKPWYLGTVCHPNP